MFKALLHCIKLFPDVCDETSFVVAYVNIIVC